MKSISLLLGAGFSAPMGYPVGKKLNDLLLNCSTEIFSFSAGGSLITTPDGKKPVTGYKNSYDVEFEFCIALMQYFNALRGYFDYEEFYDFFRYEANEDKEVERIAQPFLQDRTTTQLLGALKTVYVQVIAFYLKDANGKKYYDDEPYTLGLHFYPGYTGILKYLHAISQNHTVNVHTLNHDLLFESFANSEFMAGELSDGFEELSSPFYGALRANDRSYHARLSMYTGRYDKKFRLFKLHGSRDYAVYHRNDGALAIRERYVKTRYGIGFGDIYKEVKNGKGELAYEHCWINYHADFLTGTTSKIERYKDPLFYQNMFRYFTDNLKNADSLLIVGYGGRDSEVNRLILENFDYKNKPSYIIDLYPGDKVIELQQALNAKLIVKELNNIEIADF